MNRNQFEIFLRSNSDLSENSIKSYSNAISRKINFLANEHNFISGDLYSIHNQNDLKKFASSMESLEEFKRINVTGNNMYKRALYYFVKFLSLHVSSDTIISDLDDIEATEAPETEKRLLIDARIGQGKFRAQLIQMWGGCSVTKYPDTSILVASHIKPWARSSNSERLDPYNGLLLLPNIDKLFDRGLVTFGNDGMLVLSRVLIKSDYLGLGNVPNVDFKSQNLEYIKFHRENIFTE